MPVLGIKLGRELHRALDVREQHRHLLTLAFERGLRLQNFVGEVLRGVSARRSVRRRGRLRRHGGCHRARPAFVAELRAGTQFAPAARADTTERCRTFLAKFCASAIRVLAGRTFHAGIPTSCGQRTLAVLVASLSLGVVLHTGQTIKVRILCPKRRVVSVRGCKRYAVSQRDPVQQR